MANNWSGGLDAPMVSTIDTLLEGFEIEKEVFIHSDQRYNAAMLIKTMGKKEFIAQDSYHHFEDQSLRQALQASNTGPYTAGGAGQAVVVTLTAASVAGVGNTIPIAVGETITLNDFTEVRVMAVNDATPSITLRPLDTSLTLSIANSEWLSLSSGASGQGTTTPRGKHIPLVKRTFWMRIIKEGLNFSGSAATNRASINMETARLSEIYPGVDFPEGIGNSYVWKQQGELDFHLLMKQAHAFWFGQLNDNTNVLDTDPLALSGQVFTSEGAYWQADALGTTNTYTIGGYAFSDFTTIADSMEQANITTQRPILGLVGYDYKKDVGDVLLANGFNHSVDYTQEDINRDIFAGKSKEYNFSMSKVTTTGDFTIYFMVESLFSDPEGLGAAGYTARNLGMFFPLGKTMDPKNRKMEDRISTVYKKLGNIDRSYETWYRGKDKNGNYDQYDVNIQCEMSYRFRGMDQVFKHEGI